MNVDSSYTFKLAAQNDLNTRKDQLKLVHIYTPHNSEYYVIVNSTAGTDPSD